MKEKKYVIIGNGIDWLDKCIEGHQNSNTYYTNLRIPMKSNVKIISFIIRCWFSVRDSNHLVRKLPLRNIWYKYSVFTKFLKGAQDVRFVIYDHNRISLDEKYISWLRKKYPECKISYIFTNTAIKSGAADYGYLNKLNSMYDKVFAFDPKDCETYGYKYHHLIYQPKVDSHKYEQKYDCIFVGGAKERLDSLHSIYKRIIELGLRPCFYIVGVPEEKQLKNSDIHYNERIPYEKTVQMTYESKAIIDLLQDNSSGIALRICESVVMNKLIITDNQYVKDELFYDPNNILVINDEMDIDINFFKHNTISTSDYKYLFSVEHLFDMIEQ